MDEDFDLKSEVRRAARGDPDAASLLFDRYYPRVFRYALARLRGVADAEDVAAETFARVLHNIERFRWKGAGFEAWLFRIASNLVVDRVRTGDRELVGERSERSEPQAASAETEALGSIAGAELMAMLDDLPEDQREVLVLRFAAGLDTHEVGAVMKRKPNAIRQLQYRALSGLRESAPTEAET